MHLCFLGLYAFVILFSFLKPWPSVYEIMLMCWIGVIIMDEIRQVSQEWDIFVSSVLDWTLLGMEPQCNMCAFEKTPRINPVAS